MTFRILIMGLPGSGKTTLASQLYEKFYPKCLWLNADKVREEFNDWDFSEEGRIRQSVRMRNLSDDSQKEFVIADFVAPLVEMREIYKPDFLIWMNTIKNSQYEDTNKIFVEPTKFNCEILSKDSELWTPIVLNQILFVKNSPLS